MKQSDIPTDIPLPFAANAATGDRNAIPEASQIGTDPTKASLNDGFPPITFTDVTAGGTPPYGADFNGILYLLSAHDRWKNAGANYPFSSTYATAIGGYPKGAIVLNAAGDGFWLSASDDNSADPATDTSGAWIPIDVTGSASVSLAGSNVTLTPAQYGKPLIVLTGTLTANVQVKFPTISGIEWQIQNNTSGAFTITAKTAAGTGVSCPQSSSTAIYCDGTNIARKQGFATIAQSKAGITTNVASNPEGVAAFSQQYGVFESMDAGGISIDGGDLNDTSLIMGAKYYFSTTPAPLNAPSGMGPYGVFEPIMGSSGNRIETLTDRVNNTKWHREWSNGTPSAWFKFWDSNNLTPTDYLTTSTAASTYLPVNSLSYVRGATVQTPSWAAGTTYTNSSGKPLIMSVWGHETAGASLGIISGYIDGTLCAQNGSYGANTPVGLYMVVPAGSTFEFTVSNVTVDGMRVTY